MPRVRVQPAPTPGDGLPREVWRCTEGFSIFLGTVPEVYGTGDEVFADDPILITHRALFAPVADRVVRRPLSVEKATAVPGELRSPVLPVSTVPVALPNPVGRVVNSISIGANENG